jgi:uncharacterized membrane protein YfcA
MGLSALLVLAVTSFTAATVNGALGYGYSSISVPIALLVTVGRVLNPALVIVEVGINLYALFWNRRNASRVIRRVIPLAIGLVPGVIAGALLLGRVEPTTMKLIVFSVLLPLILLQASGRRWPIRRERRAAVPLGAGVGVIYGMTTISGPPLAILFNNQGLVKNEFRAGLALIRVAESSLTAIVYFYLGLFVAESSRLLTVIVPSVLIGIPLGAYVIRRLDAETFRRICMSFDAWVVGFGLSRVLVDLKLMASPWAYSVMAITILIDTYLLFIFFRRRRAPAL